MRKSVTDFGKTGAAGKNDKDFFAGIDFPEKPYVLDVEYDARAVLCEVRWHAPPHVPSERVSLFQLTAS